MKTNISEFLPEVAAKYPDKTAIISPDKWRSVKSDRTRNNLSFSELNRLCDSYACEFRKAGISRGMKTLIMLRPGFDFIASVFAVFKIGAVPILIDTGMGLKNLLGCIKKTAPEAIIAVPAAHWIRIFYPEHFKTVRISFTNGHFPPPGIPRLASFADTEFPNPFEIEKTDIDETAAIVFTTGSTGPPKGVVYTHGIYIAQLDILKENYGAGPGEIDMPAFPLFALFSAALGMPCVIPEMNPSRPARVDPRKIIEAINGHNVTFSFASPALWKRVSDYCIANKIRLPSLKKALMAGAPVSAELHASLRKIIAENGETIVPYGATESLPVANFAGSEMLLETAELSGEGAGYCVGYPVKRITIKIIRATDDPIPEWNETLCLPQGEKGEIAVKGPVVTKEYYNEPGHTKLAKIADSDGRIWHRIGDIGYFDNKGRLWFCGRKTHRVFTKDGILYPVCCEAIFNKHPKVFRSALVGVGARQQQTPVIIIEPKQDCMPRNSQEKEQFAGELLKLGRTKDFTSGISKILFCRSFPTDIRHNAKIFREKLALWAERKVNIHAQ